MTGLVPADAVTVAAGGAAEIGSAVATVLYDLATGTGAFVMLCAALWSLALASGWWYGRRHPMIAPPEPGDDALAEFGGLADAEIERTVARWSRQQGDGRD